MLIIDSEDWRRGKKKQTYFIVVPFRAHFSSFFAQGFLTFHFALGPTN